MKERIQKILSSRGVTSRRNAEQLIIAGRITCNGAVCKLGDSADPDVDIILVDGKELPSAGENIYIMLNKPKGFVTTLSDEKGRKNAAQLVENCGKRVYPIGRLDMDSEGILLFTNDGEFANCLMHPSHEINKVYHVEVVDYTPQALQLLEKPIFIDGYKIRPPKVKLLNDKQNGEALLEITIHEGRNRQVRRMCAKAGMRVKRLIRVQEGSLCLGDLPTGKWRHLTESELKKLI